MHDIVKRFKDRSDVLSFVAVILSALSAVLIFYITKLWIIRLVALILFFSITVIIVFNLLTRREFLEEVFSTIKPSANIKPAGIVNVTDAFIKGVDWGGLIGSTKSLDILFAYGKTWRGAYNEHLCEFVQRKGSNIRVILPDYEDEQTMKELSDRFDYLPENLKRLVGEAEEYFRELKRKNGADIEIWLTAAAPLFTLYRFDDILVLALYSHSRSYSDVPAFISKRGGVLYKYIQNEIKEIVTNKELSREVG